MINNKGFISTSVIYCLLIVFLLMLLILLLLYNNSRMLLTQYKTALKDYLIGEHSYVSSNVSLYMWKESSGNSYENTDSLTISKIDKNKSDCEKGSLVYSTSYVTVKIPISDIVSGKLECNIYYGD
ncbi:MAG: hypothetical protein R3Y13_05185 [bacterium]